MIERMIHECAVVNLRALVQRARVANQTLSGNVGGEVVEVRIGEVAAEVVADASRGLDSDVTGVRGGSALDQLGFGGLP